VTKPRSSTSEEPAISVSAAVTRPPVQDSAVATLSPRARHTSSTAVAAARSSSLILRSSWLAPGQADGGGGVGRDAFAAAGEAELFAGGCLHRHARDRNSGERGDFGAHGVAVRADARSLANQGEVKMGDAAAARAHALDRKRKKAVGRRVAPLRIAGWEMRADVALGQ